MEYEDMPCNRCRFSDECWMDEDNCKGFEPFPAEGTEQPTSEEEPDHE